MGVFYSSAIRFFGARAVPKEAEFWVVGEDLTVRVKDGGSHMLQHCPCYTGQVPSSNQIQNDYWDAPCCSSYELLVNFLF